MLDAMLSKAGAPCELLSKATTKDETMKAALHNSCADTNLTGKQVSWETERPQVVPIYLQSINTIPRYIRSKGPAPMQDGTYKGTASQSKGMKRKV